MKRMKTLTTLFVTSLFVILLSSGCYTKFYNPNMEINGPYSANELYSRYDSSAIDTTLTREDWAPEYYPDNGWNNSGGYYSYPRTRWGFDFYNFSPGYYNSYYGYYDYYGSPWWYNDRYDNNSWWYRHGGGYYGGGTGAPGEPPSQRDGRRERDTYSGDGSGSTYQPGGSSGGGAVYTPAPPAPAVKPAPAPDNSRTSGSGDSGGGQKRTGKRRN
jgi:hypothetical protein